MMEFHLTKERKKEHCKSRKKKIEISLSSRWKTFFKKQKSFFTTRVEVENCVCVLLILLHSSSSSSSSLNNEKKREAFCARQLQLSLYISLSLFHTHALVTHSK